VPFIRWDEKPLAYVLNLVGVLPQAKYVVFFALDKKFDSLDMLDAGHPQTLLSYFMNGEELPTRHGAPLRVRVPRQLGFKSKKYLAHVTVTDKAFPGTAGSERNAKQPCFTIMADCIP
jgi:DMSO/TMAO reductase YedYZ molybdopterin-dependent catalytic subunit